MTEIKINFVVENADGTDCGAAVDAIDRMQAELKAKLANAEKALDEAWKCWEQAEDDECLTEEEIEDAEDAYLIASHQYRTLEFQLKKAGEIKQLLEKLEYTCLQYTWAGEE